jgi:hypothetical protein
MLSLRKDSNQVEQSIFDHIGEAIDPITREEGEKV